MKSPMKTSCASVSEVLSWNFEVRDLKFEGIQAAYVGRAVLWISLGITHACVLYLAGEWQIDIISFLN